METIASIISTKQMFEGYYQVKLKCPEGFTWTPGQFAKFIINDEKLGDGNWRIFSIASVENEGVITIGTKSLPGKESDFKKTLFAMKEGDKVTMNGPMGEFTYKNDGAPVLLYASGIGVTPIRSILKGLEGKETPRIDVVYASFDYYMFEDELEGFAAANPNLTFYKTRSIEETNAKLSELAKDLGNEARFYISGSPFVVKAVTENFTNLGIEKERIHSDVFVGY